jgi:hypothetical protein
VKTPPPPRVPGQFRASTNNFPSIKRCESRRVFPCARCKPGRAYPDSSSRKMLQSVLQMSLAKVTVSPYRVHTVVWKHATAWFSIPCFHTVFHIVCFHIVPRLSIPCHAPALRPRCPRSHSPGLGVPPAAGLTGSAGPPGRRTAGPPGAAVAPGRRAAGPPGRRAAGPPPSPGLTRRTPVQRGARCGRCHSAAGVPARLDPPPGRLGVHAPLRVRGRAPGAPGAAVAGRGLYCCERGP